MCDFICQENIKSLIDYIASQHMSAKKSASPSTIYANNKPILSLEEIANPHVTTFQQLWKAFEKNHNSEEQHGKEPALRDDGDHNHSVNGSDDGLVVNGRGGRPTLNKIALEDQVSTFHIQHLSNPSLIRKTDSCLIRLQYLQCNAAQISSGRRRRFLLQR
jgi:hypothetical protein